MTISHKVFYVSKGLSCVILLSENLTSSVFHVRIPSMRYWAFCFFYWRISLSLIGFVFQFRKVLLGSRPFDTLHLLFVLFHSVCKVELLFRWTFGLWIHRCIQNYQTILVETTPSIQCGKPLNRKKGLVLKECDLYRLSAVLACRCILQVCERWRNSNGYMGKGNECQDWWECGRLLKSEILGRRNLHWIEWILLLASEGSIAILKDK